MLPKANYHTHTFFCDGSDAPEEVVRAAVGLGFTRLGFSGHSDPAEGVPMDIGRYTAEIRRLQAAWKDRIEIFLGVEQDLYAPMENLRGLDYWIGSTHFIRTDTGLTPVDQSQEILSRLCGESFGGDWNLLCRAYYRQEAEIVDRTHCTFIGHFDLVTRFNDQLHTIDEEGEPYLAAALETMEYLAKEKNVPFELNTSPLYRGRKQVPYPAPLLLRALRSFGGEIVFSSDAHKKEHLDGAFDRAAAFALAAGFDHANILTKDGFETFPLR